MKKITKYLIIILVVVGIVMFTLKIRQNNFKKSNTEENETQSNNISQETNETEANKTENNSESEDEELNKRLESQKYLSENGLPVLMYHFFYDKTKETGKDGNWLEISNFEEQIKYLSENDFYFPTWDQVEKYIDGKQELPEKSIVITVDDGDPSFFELAVPVIQKYKVPVTSFVITYWYGDRANDKQEYVNYQSHSYDMHKSRIKWKRCNAFLGL